MDRVKNCFWVMAPPATSGRRGASPAATSTSAEEKINDLSAAMNRKLDEQMQAQKAQTAALTAQMQDLQEQIKAQAADTRAETQAILAQMQAMQETMLETIMNIHAEQHADLLKKLDEQKTSQKDHEIKVGKDLDHVVESVANVEGVNRKSNTCGGMMTKDEAEKPLSDTSIMRRPSQHWEIELYA